MTDKPNVSIAIYNKAIFEVLDDSAPIYFLSYSVKSNKKYTKISFAVDSKRCKREIDHELGTYVYKITGQNSVKPI